jgi:hypothetical protein
MLQRDGIGASETTQEGHQRTRVWKFVAKLLVQQAPGMGGDTVVEGTQVTID